MRGERLTVGDARHMQHTSRDASFGLGHECVPCRAVTNHDEAIVAVARGTQVFDHVDQGIEMLFRGQAADIPEQDTVGGAAARCQQMVPQRDVSRVGSEPVAVDTHPGERHARMLPGPVGDIQFAGGICRIGQMPIEGGTVEPSHIPAGEPPARGARRDI